MNRVLIGCKRKTGEPRFCKCEGCSKTPGTSGCKKHLSKYKREFVYEVGA